MEMANQIDALIQRLTRVQGRRAERAVLDHLERVILWGEAERLVDRLDRIASGRFETSDASELAAVVRCFASFSLASDQTVWALTIAEASLHSLPEPLRGGTLEFLSGLLDGNAPPARGRVRVVSTSILKVAEDPRLRRIALQAVACGLDVRVVTTEGSQIEPPFELDLTTPSGKLTVSAGQGGERRGAAWSVEVSDGRPPPGDQPDDPPGRPVVERTLSVPQASDAAAPDPGESVTESSVVDLFGDLICLRDLQPRSSHLRGLDALRAPLGLAAPFVPRKHERDYASIVRAFVHDLAGADARIVYVGDTVFNDGSVICNLEAGAPGSVLGFLCNEKGFGSAGDFILGPIYFAKQWSSLVRFLAEGRRRGLTIDARTVGLFDLDQTVYAAKGRDDEALREARWDAILAFLRDTIPSYRFNAARAERIYRQFDQDEYHRITRDNMDYVVLLVLAVAAGLCDVEEIETFAASHDNSIASLTELLHQRALVRRGHEEIEGVLEVIKAVYYNTLAGDQTPCKEFRRYECRATALRMTGEKGRGIRDRIFLNREVVDFIRFLKDRNAHILAVSDRPVEAAVIEEEDGTKEDLMSIHMKTVGFSIYDLLQHIV